FYANASEGGTYHMREKEYVREPALDSELVEEFVKAAHSDFAKVQALYEQEPKLLHATVNWGGGDWESALGAAAHLGKRDIAEWLLNKGARMDIFAAAMLGELSIVEGIINRQLEALHSEGPHGIPLIHHARMGGEEAKKVYNYLQGLLQKEVIQR